MVNIISSVEQILQAPYSQDILLCLMSSSILIIVFLLSPGLSINSLGVLMAASALIVGPSGGLSQLPLPQNDHTTIASRDKSLPTALGMRHVDSRSGRAFILIEQGK